MDELLPVVGGLVVVTFFGGFLAEQRWFGSPRGPFLRGVPVWSEALPEELVQPLSALPDLTELDGCWARRDGARLVVWADVNRAQARRYRSMWPYVARVELDRRRVGFRLPIGAAVLTLPQLIVLFPFTALLLVFNHRRQAPSVRAALRALADHGVLAAGA
ncbi:MAG: hypothetical protein ABMA64_03290 [Myxococcota bacterium]